MYVDYYLPVTSVTLGYQSLASKGYVQTPPPPLRFLLRGGGLYTG